MATKKVAERVVKNVNNLESDKLSKRKQFNQIKFDPKILQSIKTSNIGKIRLQSNKSQVFSEQNKSELDKIFGRKLKFVGAAATRNSFLPPKLPEIAFIGRSNVGKSSLINALTGSTTVRISDKPGTTQTINWFELPNVFYLVDLPGYGFAFTSDEKKEQWNKLTEEYLTTRKELQKVCVLVDSRHGLKQSDIQMLSTLNTARISFNVILTKCDLVQQLDLARQATLTQTALTQYSYHKNLILLSAKKNQGLNDLKKDLFSCIHKLK